MLNFETPRRCDFSNLPTFCTGHWESVVWTMDSLLERLFFGYWRTARDADDRRLTVSLKNLSHPSVSFFVSFVGEVNVQLNLQGEGPRIHYRYGGSSSLHQMVSYFTTGWFIYFIAMRPLFSWTTAEPRSISMAWELFQPTVSPTGISGSPILR